jgi:serine/threonine-protein kinase
MSLDPRVGTRIGDYEIQQLIGRGGMSVVYLAEHIRLHRKVALKLLSPEMAEDDTFRRRFTSEWERLAQLDHPNIIPIFEAGEAGGLLFIAMRYVQTTDLKGLIGHEGRLEPERAVSIIAQTASALDAAHQQDLVHRDVKPHNILVATGSGAEGEDHVYLSDFGLTKHTQSRSGLTQTGHFMGTIDYVAPEQIAGKTVDGRTDEYALGCVLYECLTGRPPFQREEDTAILFAHLQEPAPLASELRPDLPPALDEVIATAMAKDPDQRYPTCLDFARAARRVVRLGSTPAGGLSRPTDGVGVGTAGSEGVLGVTEPTPAIVPDPRLGSTIGRYHLKEVLGRGAMGVVYLGEHTVTGKQVALKLMSPHLFADPQAMQRFLQEARAADVLEHPNIVPIFDADEIDGVPYIAMKRVQGESLADTIEREGALEPQRGLGLLGQVATALDFAHERGIVHRDVKPHNILIASENDPAGADQAYLCDFGIIKDTAVSRGLTAPAQTVGTRDYMAPEQFRGDPVDGRTDVYALGCVLFETLTGSPPFASEGADALMYAHLEKPPPSAHERRPDLPPSIDGVLHKALAKRPEDRFGKPTDLLIAAWGSISGQPAEVSQTVIPEDVVAVSATSAMPPMPTVIAAAPGAPADVGSIAPWQTDPGAVAPPAEPTVVAPSFSPPVPVQDRTGSDGALPDLAPPPPARPSAPAPSGDKPGRGRLMLVAAIVGVLALVGGAAIALSGGDDDDPVRAGGPTGPAETGPAATGPAETGPAGETGEAKPPVVKEVNAPRNVEVATRAPGLIRIEWKAAAAGGEVARFLVIRDGEEVDEVRTEFYRDTDVSPGETHEYLIVAVGRDGSEAPADRPVRATVPAPIPPPSTGGDTGGDTGGGDTGGDTGGGDTCTAEEFFNGECS